MFDWFGGLKWLLAVARKDKALALIAVLLIVIAATSWVSWQIFQIREEDQKRTIARLERQIVVDDSLLAVERAKTALCELGKLDLIKEFNQDLKDQRQRIQEIEDEKRQLANEAATANKRNTRKLKTLSSIISNK